MALRSAGSGLKTALGSSKSSINTGLLERLANFRIFSTENHTSINDLAESQSVRAEKGSRASVEQARELFFQRRHLQKDHIIQAHHYDLRISAIRLTQSVNEAAQRHKHIPLESKLWGEMAAGAALYSSFLRGEERIKVQTVIGNESAINEADASRVHNLLVESFAVGELRGYAKLSKTLLEETGNNTATQIAGGSLRGVFSMNKILYGLAKPYESRIPSYGSPVADWQKMFDQSEQVPTFVHIHIEDPVETPGSDHAETKFAGGLLVQVLAGPSDPKVANEFIAEATSKQREDADVEETEAQRIKRVQLGRLTAGALMIDMKATMEKRGVVGYVEELLKTSLNVDVKSSMEEVNGQQNLASQPSTESDSVHTSDVELKQEAKSAKKAPTEALEDILKANHWQYRPQAFFCRCSGMKAVDRLKTLPMQLLRQIHEDGQGEVLKCGFCNSEVNATHEDVEMALRGQ